MSNKYKRLPIFRKGPLPRVYNGDNMLAYDVKKKTLWKLNETETPMAKSLKL